MSLYSKNTTSNLIPCLRYRDVPAALDWLCRVFDFERQNVVEDPQAGAADSVDVLLVRVEDNDRRSRPD